MTGLQIRSIDFFLILCSEIEEKFNASTFKTCHFKASGDITTDLTHEPLTITLTNDQKLGCTTDLLA